VRPAATALSLAAACSDVEDAWLAAGGTVDAAVVASVRQLRGEWEALRAQRRPRVGATARLPHADSVRKLGLALAGAVALGTPLAIRMQCDSVNVDGDEYSMATDGPRLVAERVRAGAKITITCHAPRASRTAAG